MKTIISLLIVMVLLLGCVGLFACSAKNGGTTQDSSSSSISSTKTNTSTTTTKSSSVGGLTWNDMPIYSGAGKIDTYQWSGSFPTAEGDYSKFEYRYYETNDSLDKVSAFYRSQMPTKGWNETGWMETPQLKYGIYTKNNENDEAMVEIMSDTSNTSKTVIVLWRATK